MSLESNYTQGNQLSLYQSIEHQLVPHTQSVSTSAMSSQFYKATRKPKVLRIVVCAMLLTLVGLFGVLQYVPGKILDPYRPLALYNQFNIAVVDKANAISTIMDYERCIQKAGTVVKNTPNYCIVENKRYYQNDTTTLPSKSLITVAPVNEPLRKSEMSVFIPSLLSQKSLQVLSGYPTETSQNSAQLRTLPVDALTEEALVGVDNFVTGQALDLKVLAPFLLSDTELNALSVLVDNVTTAGDLSILYPGYAIKTLIASSSSLQPLTQFRVLTVLKSASFVSVVLYTMPGSFVTAYNEAIQKECVSQTDDALKNCALELLKDKSLSQKLNQEAEDLIKLFAFAS